MDGEGAAPRTTVTVLWPDGDVAVTGDGVTVQVVDPELACEVELTLVLDGSVLAIAGVSLGRRPQGPPVVGSTLARVRVDAYLEQIRAELARLHEHPVTVERRDRGTATTVLPITDTAVHAARLTPDRSMRSVTLEMIAEVYREALTSDVRAERRAPVAVVARRFALHRINAARFVSQARRAGVLEAAPARPTPR